MPPLTIFSPYSGRPVMVREQDLGRAIRDEGGRVFYVVEDAEHGRYAAKTRKGSPKELDHYRGLETQSVALSDNTSASPATHEGSAHDATGAKRRNPVGIATLVVALLLVLAAGYVFGTHPEWLGLETPSSDPPDTSAPPSEPDATGEQSSQALPLRTMTVAYAAPAHAEDEAALEDAPPEPTNPTTDEPTQAQAADEAPEPEAPESPQPVVSDSPPTLPENAEQYADRLSEAGEDELAPTDDPQPVIVPTRTWRPEPQPEVSGQAEPGRFDDFRHTASGLRYKVTHQTDGPPAQAGNYLRVRYTAQTLDGQSLIDDASQSFVLMTGQAIRAFDEGLAGIREGEQLLLFVPRGHSEAGTLPGIKRVPDQPFLLDVQLVSVRPGVTHIVEGPGDADQAPAMPGDRVHVHYVARVEGKDQVIDSTAQRGKPMAITLGQHAIIPGLELGITGMRPGETRLLTIPPYLAYGEKGVAGGLIPPNAVLSFRITLVGIEASDDEPEDESH